MKNLCPALHEYFNSLKRFSYPIDKDRIPKNGIYIVFEKGETAHSGDRIVRIGTHTGQDRLYLRLKSHFIEEKKDFSIFRKNIGRALLNKANDPFLKYWNIDLVTHAAKIKYAAQIDLEYQAEIEKRVSDYLRDSFSFTVC